MSSRVEAANEPREHTRVGPILHLEPHLALGFVEVDHAGGCDGGTPLGIQWYPYPCPADQRQVIAVPGETLTEPRRQVGRVLCTSRDRNSSSVVPTAPAARNNDFPIRARLTPPAA